MDFYYGGGYRSRGWGWGWPPWDQPGYGPPGGGYEMAMSQPMGGGPMGYQYNRGRRGWGGWRIGYRNNPTCQCSPISMFFFLVVWSIIVYYWATIGDGFVMEAGETRILPLNGLLQKSVTIVDYSANLQVFHAPLRPRLMDPSTASTVSNTETVELGGDDYLDFGYWLNYGTTIEARISSERGGYLYIFQGDAAFAQWEKDADDTWGLKNSVYSSNNRGARLRFKVEKDDQYYVVVDNPSERPSRIDVSFSIARTQYDTGKLKPVCSHTSSCPLSLGVIGGKDVIILQSPPVDSTTTDETTYQVDLETEPRIVAVAVVMLLPLLVCMLVSCVCFKDPGHYDEAIEMSQQQEDGRNRQQIVNNITVSNVNASGDGGSSARFASAPSAPPDQHMPYQAQNNPIPGQRPPAFNPAYNPMNNGQQPQQAYASVPVGEPPVVRAVPVEDNYSPGFK